MAVTVRGDCSDHLTSCMRWIQNFTVIFMPSFCLNLNIICCLRWLFTYFLLYLLLFRYQKILGFNITPFCLTNDSISHGVEKDGLAWSFPVLLADFFFSVTKAVAQSSSPLQARGRFSIPVRIAIGLFFF